MKTKKKVYKVYRLLFTDGSIYIGVTSMNIGRRNYSHRKHGSINIQKKLEENNTFITEILGEFTDSDKAYKLEGSLVRRYKKEVSVELLNNAYGGKVPRGQKFKCIKSKRKVLNLDHYIQKQSSRQNFKKVCKTQNWVFEDFEEIDTGEKKYGGTKMFHYRYDPENTFNRFFDTKKISKPHYVNDCSRYETFAVKRHIFKKVCDRRGWVFEDFKEVESGERELVNADKLYYAKKYNYFMKE